GPIMRYTPGRFSARARTSARSSSAGRGRCAISMCARYWRRAPRSRVSALADGAVECGAVREHHASDRRAAHHARLARAVVDAQPLDEPAAFAERVTVVADRGASIVDRFLKHVAQVVAQCRRLAARHPMRAPRRPDPRAEESLVRVDVAPTCDPALVEEEVAYRGGRAACKCPERFGRECVAQRLEPELRVAPVPAFRIPE